MSTINSIPFRSTIFYRNDGTVAPLGTVFTIGINNTMSTTNSLSIDTLTASTIVSFSTITASTIRTTGPSIAIGQNVSNPNRFVEIRSDIANSSYLDFHSSDSAVPDFSTRIQSLGGATSGTGALNMTASTMGLMASSGVGIGTTIPQAPLHVYNALGVSLSNTNTVNYTQSAILGFNYGGGSMAGTRDSFRILSQTVNRDNGAGPTFFDYGAQADLIFQRKTNNLYSNGVNDKTYTEVMRLGGATGFVGIGTAAPSALLHVYNSSASFTAGPTVHIGDGQADAGGTYGMINLVRANNGADNKAHLAFIKNGLTIFGMGYYPGANLSVFGLVPSYGTMAATTGLWITDTGSVGIGSTVPGSRLDVSGSILGRARVGSSIFTTITIANTSFIEYTVADLGCLNNNTVYYVTAVPIDIGQFFAHAVFYNWNPTLQVLTSIFSTGITFSIGTNSKLRLTNSTGATRQFNISIIGV